MSAALRDQLEVQITGQALARSFLKLIPGAGSVVSAGVAFSLTAASGEGWLQLSEQVHTGKLGLEKISESWGQYAPTVRDVVCAIPEQRIAKPSPESPKPAKSMRRSATRPQKCRDCTGTAGDSLERTPL